MDEITRKAVETYQCPGCVCGNDISCYKKGYHLECGAHVIGTMELPPIGRFLLGMPRGFNRVGASDYLELYIFATKKEGWLYDKYNRPVWKHLDEHNNTIVRGLSPRINCSWTHIFLEDCMDQINCMEITQADIDEMD